MAQAGVVARDGPRHRVRLARRARARGARRRRAHHHRGVRFDSPPPVRPAPDRHDRRDPHLQPRRRVRRARRRRRPLHGDREARGRRARGSLRRRARGLRLQRPALLLREPRAFPAPDVRGHETAHVAAQAQAKRRGGGPTFGR